MLYTFYEDLGDYQMAALEYQKAAAERDIEATNKRIEIKESAIKTCQDSSVGKSSTTAGTLSLASHFRQ